MRCFEILAVQGRRYLFVYEGIKKRDFQRAWRMSTPGESLYRVLKKPIITEKTAIAGSYSNAVVFEVNKDANKNEIKRAVEKIFDVKVKKVRTANFQGKLKKVKNRVGAQPSWKKAYVLLQPGEQIQLMPDQ